MLKVLMTYQEIHQKVVSKGVMKDMELLKPSMMYSEPMPKEFERIYNYILGIAVPNRNTKIWEPDYIEVVIFPSISSRPKGHGPKNGLTLMVRLQGAEGETLILFICLITKILKNLKNI